MCVCVCMFAIGGRAVGLIGPKFCTEVALRPGSVLGWVRVGRPPPPGRGWPRSAGPARTVRFPETFIKQKLENLLYIWQCVCVCVYVRYRRPRRRSKRAEILHGGGPPPRERLRLGSGRPAPTPWAGLAPECFPRSAWPEPCVSQKTL